LANDIAHILLVRALIKFIKLILDCFHVLEVVFEATTSHYQTASSLSHFSNCVNLLVDLATLKVYKFH
jgi:hypothetical protein